MNERLEWQAERFWLNLRNQLGFNGKLGRGYCSLWCDWTLDFLPPNLGFRKETAYRGECEGLRQTRAGFHSWLQKVQNERRFIADGTAGQFIDDERYQNGFYGWIEEAPEELIEIYASY